MWVWSAGAYSSSSNKNHGCFVVVFFLFLREDAWLEGIFLVAINIFDWLWVLLSVVSQRFGIFSCPRSGSLPPGDTYYRVMAVRFQPTWQPTWRRPLSQKLSEAFEQLSAAAPTAAAQAAAARPAKRKREKPWWDVPTWEEIWMELEMGWWMIFGIFFLGETVTEVFCQLISNN